MIDRLAAFRIKTACRGILALNLPQSMLQFTSGQWEAVKRRLSCQQEADQHIDRVITPPAHQQPVDCVKHTSSRSLFARRYAPGPRRQLLHHKDPIMDLERGRVNVEDAIADERLGD